MRVSMVRVEIGERTRPVSITITRQWYTAANIFETMTSDSSYHGHAAAPAKTSCSPNINDFHQNVTHAVK